MVLGPNFDGVLQAARLGAEWAWTQIYRDLSPAVLRYLTAQGAENPEDLLGELFLRIVQALPTFEGDEQRFRAWVFTCARNLMRDAWRRSRRAPIEYMSHDLLAEIGGNDSTESETARREAYERVQKVLSRLTPEQRDVVFLRIIVGLSIEEVTHVLSKSPGSVKSLQSRALASIRRAISKEAVS